MKVLFFLLLLFGSRYINAQTFRFANTEMASNLISVTAHVSDFAYFQKSDISFNLKNGSDHIEVPYKQPQFIELVCNWANHKKTSLRFLASADNYIINISKNFELSLISNVVTAFQIKYEVAEKQKLELYFVEDSLRRKLDYSKPPDFVEARINHLQDSIASLIDSCNLKNYEANLDNFFGLFSLCKFAEYPLISLRRDVIPDSILLMTSRLARSVQQSPVCVALKEKLKKAKTLLPGKKFQFNLELLDTAGSGTNLSVYKGKYLLIDFWASWCIPCREEAKYLVTADKMYKAKDLQIISISLDEVYQKKFWMRSIYQDKINSWPQFSDFNHKAKTRYNIKLIPANILVDKQGVIVGKNLFGAKLLEKLSGIIL